MKSPLTLVKSLLAVAGVAAVSAVSAAPASAFGFGNIAGGDTPGDPYKDSFTWNLINQGPYVLLTVKNSGHPAALGMFISKVFLQDPGYLSNPEFNIGNVGTVNFENAGNDQLPQGGNNFTTAYSFSRVQGPANGNGVQAGETFGMKFTGNYNLVTAAFNSGAMKVGIHVQGLPNGASDSYIGTNTQDTPEPLTMLAAGAAVGFGTMFKKQRDQAQKAE